MARVGKRVGLGLVVGLVVGLAAGLIVAILIHAHSYTFWGYVLGLGIFGLICGAFIGGMTSLANPGYGDEPTDPVD